MQNEKISILLIDDHQLVRDSLESLLCADPRFEIAGSTGDPELAVSIAFNRRPRVITVDINMRPVDGFELTKRLRKYAPASHILGLSLYVFPAYVKKMLLSGAKGYISKFASGTEFLTAIEKVSRGEQHILNGIEVEANYADHVGLPQEKLSMLTFREMEIIRLIKDGKTSQQIADLLFIDRKTVDVHRHSIFKKLDIKNTAALINLAFTYSLI